MASAFGIPTVIGVSPIVSCGRTRSVAEVFLTCAWAGRSIRNRSVAIPPMKGSRKTNTFFMPNKCITQRSIVGDPAAEPALSLGIWEQLLLHDFGRNANEDATGTFECGLTRLREKYFRPPCGHHAEFGSWAQANGLLEAPLGRF
jgi:hypothetical protein